MKNQLLYDKFIQCEYRLPPLLSLPLNRIPTYTYPGPPAPFCTLFFLLGGLCLPVHTRKTQYKTVYTCRSQVGTRHRAQSTHSYPPRGSFPNVNQHHLLTTLKTIRPIKSRKRDIRKKNYFPGHFDR